MVDTVSYCNVAYVAVYGSQVYSIMNIFEVGNMEIFPDSRSGGEDGPSG